MDISWELYWTLPRPAGLNNRNSLCPVTSHGIIELVNPPKTNDDVLSGDTQHIEFKTNGRHFADDIFKCIFSNEIYGFRINISRMCAPKGPINIILALVAIMAWPGQGVKPLSEPIMVSLVKHICDNRPQWGKWILNIIKTGRLYY